MATKTKTTTKTKGSTVEFHVELPVTAKDLRDIIEGSLQELVDTFAYGDKDIRKQVEDLRKSLFTDGKFRQYVANYYAKELKSYIRHDLDYNGVNLSDFPAIAKMIKGIEKRDDELFEEYSKEAEQKRIQDMIKMLKEQGYTVTQR